jgi:hypothetical protein
MMALIVLEDFRKVKPKGQDVDMVIMSELDRLPFLSK